MPAIRFYVDPTKVDKNGFAPIKANIAINNKNNWKTVEKVKPRYWNKLKQRVNANRENEPDNRHAIINSLLDDYRTKATTFFNQASLNGIQLTEKNVTDFFNGKDFFRKKAYLLNEVFEEFLKVTNASKTLATLKNRTTVFKFLCSFQEYSKENISMSEIDLSFFDSFKDYAFNKRGVTDNYFAKIIAVLKTFLNWASERDYYTGTKHKGFKASERDIDIIYLTKDEFCSLYEFQFKDLKLDRVRDIYCFGVFTGLRYEDLKHLRQDNYINGSIQKTVRKTKTAIIIPLIPAAIKIIEKYEHPVKLLPQLSNQKFNDYIKICCELAGINQEISITRYRGKIVEEITKPKFKFITAHTARKTAVTLNFMNGMDVKVVKSITGHTQDKTFDKYLKVSDQLKNEQLFNAWEKVFPKKVESDELIMPGEGI